MALPPVLSEEALNRFRTKHCERLLVAGSCHFGDKCQYSHDRAWLRRNPKKRSYSSQMCPYARHGSCVDGEECKFAHSRDEELYHPCVYKSVLCSKREACDSYYCPFAHREAEIRKPPNSVEVVGDIGQDILSRNNGHHRRRGARQSRQNDHELSGTTPGHMSLQQLNSEPGSIPTTVSKQSAYFRVDDFLQVAMLHSNETGLTGRIVPGLLQQKSSNGDEAVACRVKLVSAGRKECAEAARVVKEIKRWMNFSRDGGISRALDLRRTVATIYLAIPQAEDPQVEPVFLCNGRLAGEGIKREHHLSRQVATWVSQLVSEVHALHADSIAHWCISPQSIFVDPDGFVYLGDFLGKIRALFLMTSGWSDSSSTSADPCWEWAVWYPPEVHDAIGAIDPIAKTDLKEAIEVNRYAIDSWQLGVTIFYILTGEHMYGSLQNPKLVCENICCRRPVNLAMLSGFPLFKNFCQSLASHDPAGRPSTSTLKLHPLLWSMPDASSSLAALPSWLVSILTKHLPCFSLFDASQDVVELPDSFVTMFVEQVMSQKDLSQIPWDSQKSAFGIEDPYKQQMADCYLLQGDTSLMDKFRTISTCSTLTSPTSESGMAVTPVSKIQYTHELAPSWLYSTPCYSHPSRDEAVMVCGEPGFSQNQVSQAMFMQETITPRSLNWTMGYDMTSGTAKTFSCANAQTLPSGFTFQMDSMEPAKVLSASCVNVVAQDLDSFLSMEPMRIYTSHLLTERDIDRMPVSLIDCMPESDSESLFQHFPFDIYLHDRIYTAL